MQKVNVENSEEITKTVIKETAYEFSKRVEELAQENDLSYLEAVQKCGEESNYEPERIAKLLSGDLYAKIQREAEKVNLVKKSGNSTLDDL